MKKLIVFLMMVATAMLPLLAVSQPEIKSANYTITNVSKYNIQVVRIAGRRLTVDVEGFRRQHFQVPRDFTFDVDGEQLTLNQLRPGQRLRAYVTQIESGELLLVQSTDSTEGIRGEEVDMETEATPAQAAEESAAE